MEKIIDVSHLSFGYEEGKKVLKDLSFSVEEGEYVAIIGHNGSGKSTLAKLLSGIHMNFSGDISIFNIPLDNKSIFSIRRRMGLVFQNPDNQFVGSTVRDDIAFGLENREVPSKDMDEVIDRYAKRVGMFDYLDKAPENLSGGQKQRVAIAGVLAMSPELIIYDEATSMLDPVAKKEILDLTFSLKEENPKLTVLSITHDVEEASKADKVLVLNAGEVALFGTPKDVFSHIDTLRSLRLDLPFGMKLIEALKEKGVSLPNDVFDLASLERYLCQ